MLDAQPTLRILAFEPFDAGSHRAVRESISRHSRHRWHWFTRPGRFWKWRMRTAAIELLDQAAGEGALDERVDSIFVTSLMSAADLRAMLPVRLRDVPIVLYMHENQAVYPQGRTSPLAKERDLHFPLTNLTSVLAADRVIWNSAWNRDSFLDGVEEVLRFSPDVKLPNVRQRIEEKSEIIWPPVEPLPTWLIDRVERTRILHNAESAASSDSTGQRARKEQNGSVADEASPCSSSVSTESSGLPSVSATTAANPIRIAWPHRWEHDKGPDELLELARAHTRALNLRWTILGERYRAIPEALETFQREFADAIDHIGYEPGRERYWQRLAQCDWVLSTARHEFFGIAVVEALLADCLPWLPHRLSYPELLPACAHGLSPADPSSNPERIRHAIKAHLEPVLAPSAVTRIDHALIRTSTGVSTV